MIPEPVQLIAKGVVILYALCAMVILGMNHVGNLTAEMAKTRYVPDSARNLQAWSRRTKLIHAAIFVAALIVGFWPA